MEQQQRPRFPHLREWIDPLSVVVIVLILVGALIFVMGYVHLIALLQALGGLLVGAGLSALVGALTGRWAIQQQSAKEANVWRKEHTYGPLYTELKAVRTALDKAEKGEAPAPQRIDNGVEVHREGGIPIPPHSSLTLRYWPEFRRDYRDTEFKIPTREQLNKVDELTTIYNTAVESARQVAVPILASHADTAITELRQSEDYKQWQHAKQTATPVPLVTSQERHTTGMATLST